MYLLFRYKNWEPSKYIEMCYNERMIVRKFMEQMLEDWKKEMEE